MGQKNDKAWPAGWPKNLIYPEIPVYDILDQTAHRVPDRTAIIYKEMRLTYAQLADLSLRFAATLLHMGIRKGDRVAIHMPNCLQYAVAYFGILRAGAVFTPLSPLLKPREILHQLNDSGAETLISQDLLLKEAAPIVHQTKIKRCFSVRMDDNILATDSRFSGQVRVEGINLDIHDIVWQLHQYQPEIDQPALDVKKDLAHLAYTGGTTGVSKGVMLTHYNVVANVMQCGNWWTGAITEMVDGAFSWKYPPGRDPSKWHLPLPDRETALVVVPWYHAMGTIGALNMQIYNGITIVLFPRFEPREYIDGVARYGATIVGGAPQLYIPIINLPDFSKFDLSGIKLATSGAAPLPLAVLNRLLTAFTKGVVLEGYGLTECTMGVTTNPPGREAIKVGSVGLPIFDTEVKTVGLIDGEDLPPGSEGEICVKGPQLMQGYWKRPDATAEVMKNGWLHTGDIGREDEDGFFYITDRKKDLILYKGYNVYPREIEEVLFEHPAIQQCAVIGKPDPTAGEIPVAFVQLKKEANASQAELIAFANEQLAHYKKVRDLILVDEIPVSGAGKVLKRSLRDHFIDIQPG